jgi:hypothetical protein
MKLLSPDTTPDAQRFLVNRLKQMSVGQKMEVTAASIAAGLDLSQNEAGPMNPFEIASEVTEFLEQEGVEYFLGGSLASTLYGEPRFTQDVDIVVRLRPAHVSQIVQQFQGGYYLSSTALEDAIRLKQSANLIHLKTNFKIDLIVSRERPFEMSRFQRRVRRTVAGRQFWFCSPEDIVLVKLEWYRDSGEALDRQLRDIQTVLMVQEGLDLGYLRSWADKLDVRELLEASLSDARLDD